MQKKYLKTSEDVEALRNTDTKIHEECHTNIYWKFVNGVLCKFYTNMDGFTYNTSFTIGTHSNFYIEAEDEPLESFKDYIGKLGFFWNDTEIAGEVGWLSNISTIVDTPYKRRGCGCMYKHFRPLTPEEVEKYTGYEVIKEE